MNIFDEFNNNITRMKFDNRPIKINYRYRLIYQISLILLIININSTSHGASMLKIQILSSAIKDDKLYQSIDQLVNKSDIDFLRTWKFNPFITRAIKYSDAYNLTTLTNTGKIKLTNEGLKFLSLIQEDEKLLTYEKIKLKHLGKKFSDSKIEKILKKV